MFLLIQYKKRGNDLNTKTDAEKVIDRVLKNTDFDFNCGSEKSSQIKESKNGVINGFIGVDKRNNPIKFKLNNQIPHALIIGCTGSGKTVLLYDILYSVLAQTTPKELRVAIIDGKGNSFESMGLGEKHQNPFLYAPPADASWDIEYARALISDLESECHRRIDLLKKNGVSNLFEYNEKHPDKTLPEILLIIDEFGALFKMDKELNIKEYKEKNTFDKLRYLAIMSRSAGIRMILSNQSIMSGDKGVRNIACNIPNCIGLRVSTPGESDFIFETEKGILSKIKKAGRFYIHADKPRQFDLIEGQAMYLSQNEIETINNDLIKQFGEGKYVKTRKEIMK